MEHSSNEHIDNNTLAAFLDDVLEDQERKNVLNHLRACDECRLKMAETSVFLQELEDKPAKGGAVNNPWYKALKYSIPLIAASVVLILVLPFTDLPQEVPQVDEAASAPAPQYEEKMPNKPALKPKQTKAAGLELDAQKQERIHSLMKRREEALQKENDVMTMSTPEPYETASSPEDMEIMDDIVTAEAASEHYSLPDIEMKLKTVYFDSNTTLLTDPMKERIAHNYALVKETDYYLKLEGNSDDQDSDENSYVIGLKYTSLVKEYLMTLGLEKERISMVSFGKSNPVCVQESDACRLQNRRVDFKLLP